MMSLFEKDFMTGFFYATFGLNDLLFLLFSPMCFSKKMNNINIEEQLIHALENNKESWKYAWQINHASKAELQKLQSHINKIIVSIEGKRMDTREN